MEGDVIGVCGIEARGLVEGSSSPPNVGTPSQNSEEDFVERVRGETPGREDSNPEELDPCAEKTMEQKAFGWC